MTTNERVLGAVGLVRHPTPTVIAAQLRQLATTLEAQGERSIEAARILSARGYPSVTLGDGGSSSGGPVVLVEDVRVSVTATEVAAFDHDRWSGADALLARLLRTSWSTTVRIESLIADLLAHADDVDEVPAGTGSCEACSKVCRPTAKDPENRLRSGLCDACRKHWARSGITDRGDWLLLRRAMLKHREGAEGLTGRFSAALEEGSLRMVADG